jgi:lipopolysaccharide biosynthesis regulator YciM
MATRQIQAPDVHYLNSAIGWLELGDTVEAKTDIEKIGMESRHHPDVLIVRWKVHAQAKDWNRALDVAQALVSVSDDKPTGWICLAYSLYNNNRSEDAWTNLLGAEKRFPEISAIPYFLACLACQMGRTNDATKWLSRWNEMVNESDIKETARQDPRLKEAWKDFDETVLSVGLRSSSSKNAI